MTSSPMHKQLTLAIVPAAGIGARMGAAIPKQYLPLGEQTILGQTLDRLLAHQGIDKVIVALHPDDVWFAQLPQAVHPKIDAVVGGKERADSVLAALESLDTVTAKDAWVLVHDAARPCLHHDDIDRLLQSRGQFPQGAILAMPVRDTMKRAKADGEIEQTVCRDNLWHALTPQMFPAKALADNIRNATEAGAVVTDEASAMEWAGVSPGLVSGRADNIKVTHPDDLPLAELFIQAQLKAQTKA